MTEEQKRILEVLLLFVEEYWSEFCIRYKESNGEEVCDSDYESLKEFTD